ncbi:hypothetical protein AB0I81_16730 [Nonomuraea sp. NPDC050404]|uniref:hypothetical protein n=1 Tax=Nonomuraea sp. NPDC050404 TaxID=3155783 RepID=UPI0033F1FF1C
MPRLLVCATTAALVLGTLTVPAQAAATSAYGFAWDDGKGHLRVLPKSATRPTRTTHALKTRAGAKELRLDYTKAAYRRVTVACDLVETEGRVAVDGKGLGRTECATADLTATLGRGPVPVRVEYRGGKATRVSEILVPDRPAPRTAWGTIKRISDTAVEFAPRGGGKKIKLGYTYATGFYRTTATCGDGWLAGKPVNAGKDGLGKKQCEWTDLTKALKSARHPVLAQIGYSPNVDSLHEVWEFFGDA